MTSGRTLMILDSVTAARAMLARGTPGSDVEILSTHYSVVDYLAARNIHCRDCSGFISAEQVRTLLADAARLLDAELGKLDETLGARICSAAGLPRMALFHACFKYLGQYNLAGLLSFEKTLDARLATGGVGAVHYLYALSTSNDPVFSFVTGAQRICRRRGIPCVPLPVDRPIISRVARAVRRLNTLALRMLQTPEQLVARIVWLLRRRRMPHESATAKIVILLTPGRESFFHRALIARGIPFFSVRRDGIVRRHPGARRAALLMVERMRREAIDWVRARPPAESEFSGAFVSHVIQCARAFFLPLTHTYLTMRPQSVGAAAWDVPPITGAHLNLLAELFLCSGVPVWGRQHGASYVDQDLGNIHFDSDFNRCTHYLSYGFGPREFAAAYPMTKPRCSFVAAGSPPTRVVRNPRAVDIVFPVTNCGPLFYLARMPEHDLAQRQMRILQAMEMRLDLNCVVKPPPHFSEDDFAHVEGLRKLRHVRIALATWKEFLSRSRPRLVVFEIASTPLYEVLSLDVDVFLMLDPTFPFVKSALEMLRRRVHIFTTTEDLVEAIMRYGLEPLPRLRDQTYYGAYVNRESGVAAIETLYEARVHSRSQVARLASIDARDGSEARCRVRRD
jgi:hypothetical protein